MDFMLLLRLIDALTYTREIIVALGLVGNILSFVVFSRKKFGDNSISVYCRALAIADCFGVVQLIYDILNYQFNLDIATVSNFACKFFFFVIFGISSIPGWLLTALSFDTMIRVMQTQRLKFINEKKYQYLIVAVIVIVNCGLFSLMPIYLEIVTIKNGNSSSPKCDLNYLVNGRFLLYLYVVESSFVPFVLMIISTLVIVKCLQNSRRRINLNQSSSSARRAKEFKFAFSSIFLNLLFIILKTPLTFYYFINFRDFEIGVLYLLSSVILYYVNYSARFLFHLIGNAVFRTQVANMIGLRKNATETMTHLNNSMSQSNHNTN